MTHIHAYGLFNSLNPFMYCVKDDLTTDKPETLLVIGIGFQHVIDIYLWYMAFCSPRRGKHVINVVAKIPEEEWKGRRDEVASEHYLP
jgi:hypothetical protein